MLEASTRPVLCFYGRKLYASDVVLYFIVRNFGSSPAIIEELSADEDFTKFLAGEEQIDMELKKRMNPISDLKGALIAPGQSKVCALDPEKTPEKVTIKVVYSAGVGKKIYKESETVDLKAGNAMPNGTLRNGTAEGNLKNISVLIQEILRREL